MTLMLIPCQDEDTLPYHTLTRASPWMGEALALTSQVLNPHLPSCLLSSEGLTH